MPPRQVPDDSDNDMQSEVMIGASSISNLDVPNSDSDFDSHLRRSTESPVKLGIQRFLLPKGKKRKKAFMRIRR